MESSIAARKTLERRTAPSFGTAITLHQFQCHRPPTSIPLSLVGQVVRDTHNLVHGVQCRAGCPGQKLFKLLRTVSAVAQQG